MAVMAGRRRLSVLAGLVIAVAINEQQMAAMTLSFRGVAEQLSHERTAGPAGLPGLGTSG